MGQLEADIYIDDAVMPDHQMDQRMTRKYIIAKIPGGHSKGDSTPVAAFKHKIAPIDSSGLFKISTQFVIVYAIVHKSGLHVFPEGARRAGYISVCSLTAPSKVR